MCAWEQTYVLLLYEHIPTALTQLRKLEHELIMHFLEGEREVHFCPLKNVTRVHCWICKLLLWQSAWHLRGWKSASSSEIDRRRSLGGNLGARAMVSTAQASSGAPASCPAHRAAQAEQKQGLYLSVMVIIVGQSWCWYSSLVKILCWVLVIHPNFFYFIIHSSLTPWL